MQSLAAFNIGLTLVRRDRSELARDWFLRAAGSDDDRFRAHVLKVAGIIDNFLDDL